MKSSESESSAEEQKIPGQLTVQIQNVVCIFPTYTINIQLNWSIATEQATSKHQCSSCLLAVYFLLWLCFKLLSIIIASLVQCHFRYSLSWKLTRNFSAFETPLINYETHAQGVSYLRQLNFKHQLKSLKLKFSLKVIYNFEGNNIIFPFQTLKVKK